MSTSLLHYYKYSSQGQPFSRAHFKTSKWPPLLHLLQVYSFQGQPFRRAHFKTSKCPPCAALHKSFIPRTTILVEPISRPLNVHPLLHCYKSRSSQGQPFRRAHFKTSKCPPLLHHYKSIHPKGNHSGEPISRLLNVHPLLHYYKSIHPKDNHSHEPILRLLNVHLVLHCYKSIAFQGQPFCRAHFKTSKCPPCCTATSMFIPRTTILASPFQDF